MSRWTAAAAGLLGETRDRLRGRDLALLSAGLTFYAGIALVPLVVLALALTARLSSPAHVQALGERLGGLLPARLGAPAAVARLVDGPLLLYPLLQAAGSWPTWPTAAGSAPRSAGSRSATTRSSPR